MKKTTLRLPVIATALVGLLAGYSEAQTPMAPPEARSTCCQSTHQKIIPALKITTSLEEKTSTTVSCQLTSTELQERKRTVIASLGKQVQEKKELPDGYAYRFLGTDTVLDELISFIKTERQCCGFFDFGLSVHNEGSVWLELTGPKGAKDFIDAEIAF